MDITINFSQRRDKIQIGSYLIYLEQKAQKTYLFY